MIHCRSPVPARKACEIVGSAMFRMVRSRLITITDRHVTPSAHHRCAAAAELGLHPGLHNVNY